jgi:hypothetical protein
VNAMTDLSANDRRNILKRAISANEGWKAYATARGLTAAGISSLGQALDICAELGIDADAAILAATGTPVEPAPVDLFAAPVATPAPVAKSAPADPLAALETLRNLLGGAVDETQVRAIVDAALAPHLEALGKPALRVVDPAGTALGVDLPPTRHPLTDTLLACVTSRDRDGYMLNVWLSGPAGSGKTYAAQQVAKALGLRFGFHGAMAMQHELIGFVDGGGTYHKTVFVDMFENGGLCLLDECDAGTSEALLPLNAPLSNGLMSLPDGRIIKRHPEFVCIGAGNTFGTGATAEYVGRNRLDAAFLDRFGAAIAWGYDEALEREICGNPEWARRVQRARQKASEAGLKVLITPRASLNGAALIANGMNPEQAAGLTYLKGLTSEQVRMIEG